MCNGWYFNFLCLSLIFCPSWHCKNKIILIGFWYCYYMYIVSQFQSVKICQNYFNCWQAIALNFLNSLFCFFFKWDLGVDAVSSFLIAVLYKYTCVLFIFPHPFLVCSILCWFLLLFFFLWSVINTTGMPCIFIENSYKLKTYTTTSTSLSIVRETCNYQGIWTKYLYIPVCT